ncbi:MAG: phosphatase PAP2 family protein [Verrucomicrobiota bacterium]
MKAASSSETRQLTPLLQLVRECSVDAFRWIRSRATVVLLFLGFFGVGLIYLFPQDSVLLEELRVSKTSEIKPAAKFISEAGDFVPFTLLPLSLLFGMATILKSDRMRRVTVAVLLASIFAGLTANVLRPTFGRARPDSKVEQGFHGPTMSARKHGFPSAHTSTAMGTAAPVLFASPVVGVPLAVVAGSVGWSRLALNRHHPADVYAGAMIGIFWGMAFGLPLRRCRMKAPKTRALGISEAEDHRLHPA